MIFHSEKLESVEEKLVKIAKEYGKKNNIIIVCGHRGKADQNLAFQQGRSRLRWPKSAHNTIPSTGIDIAPCNALGQIDWEDIEEFKEMGKKILEVSEQLQIPIVWGGAWKRLKDYVHFELVQD